jgi:uncharacterized membrane protein
MAPSTHSPESCLPFSAGIRYSLEHMTGLLVPMLDHQDPFVKMFAIEQLAFLETVKDVVPQALVYWVKDNNTFYPQFEDVD